MDDGLATGVTALAAVRFLKLNRPRSIIAAFPVCSESGRELLEAEVDQVVCVTERLEWVRPVVYRLYTDFRGRCRRGASKVIMLKHLVEEHEVLVDVGERCFTQKSPLRKVPVESLSRTEAAPVANHGPQPVRRQFSAEEAMRPDVSGSIHQRNRGRSVQRAFAFRYRHACRPAWPGLPVGWSRTPKQPPSYWLLRANTGAAAALVRQFKLQVV